MTMHKKILSIILRISTSVILLIFLFKQVDKKGMLELIRSADKYLLFLAFLMSSCVYILCLWRWEMILKRIEIHLPLKRVITSFAGGVFFSLFLPSTIGGDLVRSVDLAAHTKRPREVVATVLLDRLSGYVGLVILTLLAVSFGWRFIEDKIVIFSVALITGILIVILIVLFNRTAYSKINKFLEAPPEFLPGEKTHGIKRKRYSPLLEKVRESLKNLHYEMYIFRQHKKTILYTLLISVILQAVSPVTFYLIALSLGVKINIIYFFVFLPIIGMVALLPISIGGLGLRDATTVFFFTKIGMHKDLAFAMSLVAFLILLIYGFLGGIIYVLTLPPRRVQHHKTSATSAAP